MKEHKCDDMIIDICREILNTYRTTTSMELCVGIGNSYSYVEEIKNKAIANAIVRDNGMFGSDFDPDAPYAKTSPLMREIQGRFGTKPTDFEMELIDNNKPMQR